MRILCGLFSSKVVPWEEFARLYYKNFKSNRGTPAKDARWYWVLGVIIIKHILKLDDRGVIEMIGEHVRPIVRGKAKAKVEFGPQINVSLLNGYARVDHFDWNAYHEGLDLPAQVERYKNLTGFYPELVHVDKIYLTRENRRFLKERNIRHTGEPLGRKPAKEMKSNYQKRKERQEEAERIR